MVGIRVDGAEVGGDDCHRLDLSRGF